MGRLFWVQAAVLVPVILHSYVSAGGLLQMREAAEVLIAARAASVFADPQSIAPYSYAGCYTDNSKSGKALGYAQPSDSNMTVESCIAKCAAKNLTIAGMEFGKECYCDSYIRYGPTQLADSQCSTNCAGNATEKCGAGGKLSIYSIGPMQNWTAPVQVTTGLPDGWYYGGCMKDGGGIRSLPYLNTFANINTNLQCINLCAKFGYNAAGTEYGTQCFCGDVQNVIDAGSTPLDPSVCKSICSNDTSLLTGQTICGGGNALSFYTYNKTMYNWNFATGADAGSYDQLIGGVIIPLVTQPARNGKITFLEKANPNTRNSTGAFELDLFNINNLTLAWRQMSVKSDIFCSASLTIPDRAGRQLNVGGWSKESTKGVRLYWPDAKTGTLGVNDWEENYTDLALRAGRWYPSAMVMANGSILVMGGEKGSNDVAVPSLEILPNPNPLDVPPQFCDYLNRTDPYNLYPFLTVLPSGGIAVFYYNEARILDPITLQTKTVLPNIPGSVNRPDGGRSYPLAGVAMLLPQYAPYKDTDYLTVIICGGSTTGPSVPLDNCVSIQPDSPNPQWVLERMPSKRVMACVTALPDGTYLINNGAMSGVAGFGLASSPNLNAVLYDPKKGLNQRMTIMANTSVARLYHSESVLLDDGRVLVSGSDPQDKKNPQEYRVEAFTPPYLLKGLARPSFTIADIDFSYSETTSFTIGDAGSGRPYKVSFLGSVASTHGNSMGQRTIFPAVTCNGKQCTVTAPPNANICPPGWFQMFVLDKAGTPSVATWIRIGGDPAQLGNWPASSSFHTPKMGAAITS